MRGLYVIVSGAPGSCKTTLARALAPALDLPLFETWDRDLARRDLAVLDQPIVEVFCAFQVSHAIAG